MSATERDNGGPAFPRSPHSGEECDDGMSLRDYFAVHGQEPSQSELLEIANLVQGSDGVYSKLDGANRLYKSFFEWWNQIPIAQRFALCAEVRYLMADAMLRARQS